MSDAKSNYLENKVLDHALGTATFTKPTTVYLALYTAAPGEAGGGTECTGGSYARQAVAFGAASSGAASNSGDITFSSMPAATVVAVGVLDASSGGNLLYYKTLSSSITTAAGDEIIFPAGNITVTET